MFRQYMLAYRVIPRDMSTVVYIPMSIAVTCDWITPLFSLSISGVEARDFRFRLLFFNT